MQPPRPQRLSALLDLPNEVLLDIFDNLDVSELYRLSTVCRRLDMLALPLYLARRGIPDLERLDLYPPNFYLLPLLRRSVIYTAGAYINATFSSRKYLAEIDGLERLMSKLSFVKNIGIYFDYLKAFSTDEDEDHFLKAVHRLLDTVVSKSGSLALRNGLPLRHSKLVQKRSEPPQVPKPTRNVREMIQIRSSFGPLSLIASRARASMKKPEPEIHQHTSDLEFDPCRVSKLTVLAIDLPILFEPPLLQWTTTLINISPLQSLHLSNSQALSLDWAAILFPLSSPNLRQFTIRDPRQQIPLSSLYYFLRRHLTIYSLACQGLSAGNNSTPIFDHPALFRHPTLLSLAAGYEDIVCLLDNATVFPNLHHISFLSPSELFGCALMNDALKAIGSCDSDIELRLTFPGKSDVLQAWLNVGGGGGEERVEFSLRCVVKLLLNSESPLDPGTLALLPPWLALFPALRHVTIQRLQVDKNKIFELKFVRTIILACPKLESVCVGLDRRPVADWMG